MSEHTHLQRYLNYLGIAFSIVTAIDLGIDFYDVATSAHPSALALLRKGCAAIGWCGIACAYVVVVRHGWKKGRKQAH